MNKEILKALTETVNNLNKLAERQVNEELTEDLLQFMIKTELSFVKDYADELHEEAYPGLYLPLT